MIYKEKFKLGLKDIGKENKIKNKSILEILENIGAYHSDTVGYGVNEIPETNVSWILLDWNLKVINRPTYGQTLEIHTWGRGMNRFFTFRDYEIYDENNKLCAIATSKWTLIDVRTGKLARLTEDMINKYNPEEKSVFLEEMDKIKIPKEFTSKIEYTVIRKDIDINKHMHNLYYLDLAYEALPEDVYEQRVFDNIRITYKKEIKLGDTVICYYTKKEDSHIIVIKNKDSDILHAVIELY
jgi:medium-chain acyl-[acyl-carrier-protein] hydrolase